jgi:hypothetical protein
MKLTSTQSITKHFSLFLFGALIASNAVHAEVPAFVKESIYSPNAATVSTVAPSLAADIVILDGGLQQGMRLGMVCRVTRGFNSIGELIIIESRSDRSAGLILDLVDEATIQAGDIARVKTLQNS